MEFHIVSFSKREQRIMINFNRPVYVDGTMDYIKQAIESAHLSGDGQFTKKCTELLKGITGAQKIMLTTSGSSALEMAAILCRLKPGDEVIMPSYTFSSTANAVVMRGAVPVFVDIRPDTMNIDEKLIEDAVTDKTRAVCAVHYAGVGCEMDTILDITRRKNIKVIEDAAQGVMSTYKGRALGTIGDFGCFSFHETKNYTMGEGGAILIRDKQNNEPAEILREKGTNRSKFFRGEIDKYSWVDFGSSYLPSDLNAAYLYPQLLAAKEINDDRMSSYNYYREALSPLAEKGLIDLPYVPHDCVHNAHMFYFKVKDLEQRTDCITHLKKNGVGAVFHYVPLHSAEAGLKYGRFHGEDKYTTKESERLIRLPLYYKLGESDRSKVVETVYDFFGMRP